jgi:hypothetical protein
MLRGCDFDVLPSHAWQLERQRQLVLILAHMDGRRPRGGGPTGSYIRGKHIIKRTVNLAAKSEDRHRDTGSVRHRDFLLPPPS